jgi:hypothetical protein
VIRLAVSQNRSLMVVAAVAVAMTAVTVTMSVAMPAVTASVAAVAMWSKFL